MIRSAPFRLLISLLWLALTPGLASRVCAGETLAQVYAGLADETKQAYDASPFSQFSRDYFARITRDPSAKRQQDEVEITAHWKIEQPAEASIITTNMAGNLAQVLTQRMGVKAEVRHPGDRAPRT